MCYISSPPMDRVEWCYGQHPFLWHPMGTLTSEAGVQQGDPFGPSYFALVLRHHLVITIAKDENCQDLLFYTWYLDNGVVAGPSSQSSMSYVSFKI